MPEKLIVVEADVPEGQWWTCPARVTGPDDVVLLAAVVNGSPPYVLTVRESGDTPTAIVYTRTGAAASEVIVPPVLNSYWTVDDDGYNFIDVIRADGSLLQPDGVTPFTSTGGRTYTCEWRLNTSQFGPIFVRYLLHCRSAMST